MLRCVVAFALLVSALAGCSNADGPYGYGYAVNERPSLAQLALGPADRDNSFAAAPASNAAAAERK
jgi:hypothetical protein